MDRKIVGVSVAAIIAILLFVLLACLIWRGQTVPSTAPITPQSVVENSEAFMKDRFTGGIGLLLLMDSKTGLARVQGVITNSPAQVAGMQTGDELLAINGKTTLGLTVADVVQAIRGFVGGEVHLTLQRGESSNLEVVIHRASWKSLGLATAPPEVPAINLRYLPGVTNANGVQPVAPIVTNGLVR